MRWRNPPEVFQLACSSAACTPAVAPSWTQRTRLRYLPSNIIKDPVPWAVKVDNIAKISPNLRLNRKLKWMPLALAPIARYSTHLSPARTCHARCLGISWSLRLAKVLYCILESVPTWRMPWLPARPRDQLETMRIAYLSPRSYKCLFRLKCLQLSDWGSKALRCTA